MTFFLQKWLSLGYHRNEDFVWRSQQNFEAFGEPSCQTLWTKSTAATSTPAPTIMSSPSSCFECFLTVPTWGVVAAWFDPRAVDHRLFLTLCFFILEWCFDRSIEFGLKFFPHRIQSVFDTDARTRTFCFGHLKEQGKELTLSLPCYSVQIEHKKPKNMKSVQQQREHHH